MDNEPYNYRNAGFSRFFRRSIDNAGDSAASLPDLARTATKQTRNINFDQSAISGNMAGVTKIGENIELDGMKGRISILNEGEVVVALGDVSRNG